MEYWDIYDKDGNFTGKIIEKGTAFLPGDITKPSKYGLSIKTGIFFCKNAAMRWNCIPAAGH